MRADVMSWRKYVCTIICIYEVQHQQQATVINSIVDDGEATAHALIKKLVTKLNVGVYVLAPQE